jgi:hypothetical protein
MTVAPTTAHTAQDATSHSVNHNCPLVTLMIARVRGALLRL